MTRAVIADVEQHATILNERARLGIDRWDEVWEGVLHMVPPPAGRHQRFGTRLAAALLPVASERGLLMSYETGVWRADDDYRIPDLAVYRRESASDRGVDGPPLLAVEIRSPGDETDAKIAWYLALGVTEVIVVERDSLAATLHTAGGTVEAPFRVATLDVLLSQAAGGLRVELPSGATVDITAD